jgi:hypothetical protein
MVRRSQIKTRSGKPKIDVGKAILFTIAAGAISYTLGLLIDKSVHKLIVLF